MRRVDLLIVTAVWGPWHLDAWLEAALPTLLASGNLPALAARHGVTYQINTRAGDLARIRAAPSFQRLAALVPVSLQVIADERQLDDPIEAHGTLWRIAIDEAARSGRFAFLLPPDLLWSDGSLGHVAELLAQGKAALFAAFPRVASNSFLPAFRARFAASGDAVALTGRALVGWCLEHLHPLMAAHARASAFFPMHAEMAIWPVPDEGLAVRAFSRELMVFDAARLRLNRLFLLDGPLAWDDLHMVDDSDRLFAVSLAPLGKDVAWHTAPWRTRPLDVAQWSLAFDSPSNDLVAAARIRWHVGPTTEPRWRPVELAGALFSRRTAVEREALRVLAHLARIDSVRTAEVRQLLALALLSGRLTRALRGLPRRRDRTAFVFLPVDAALRTAWPAGWPDLVAAPGAGLERWLRAHVALAGEWLDLERLDDRSALALGFLSGRQARLERAPAGWALDGTAVTRLERVSADLVLCYIPAVLYSGRPAAGRPPSDPVAGRLPSDPAAGTAGVSRGPVS